MQVLFILIGFFIITFENCSAEPLKSYFDMKIAAQKGNVKELDTLVHNALCEKNTGVLKSNLNYFDIALGYLRISARGREGEIYKLLTWSIDQTIQTANVDKGVAEEEIKLLSKAASLADDLQRSDESLKFCEQEEALILSFFPETDCLVNHKRLARLYLKVGAFEKAKAQDEYVSRFLDIPRKVPAIEANDQPWAEIFKKPPDSDSSLP